MNIEKKEEKYFEALRKQCVITGQGYECDCPFCGGYAIVAKSMDGTVRILCTKCKTNIRI